MKKPSKSPNTICRAKEPLLLAVLHLRRREWWVVVDLEALPVTLAPHLRVASPGASTSTICGNDTAIIPRIALLLKLSLLALRRASETGARCQDALISHRGLSSVAHSCEHAFRNTYTFFETLFNDLAGSGSVRRRGSARCMNSISLYASERLSLVECG